jgi:hypothetical protein
MTKLIAVVLFIAAAAAASVQAAERTREVTEPGQPAAQFTIGDSRCELVNDQLQCSRVER